MLHETEITQIWRRVLSELSRLAFKHSLVEQVQDILTTVVIENGTGRQVNRKMTPKLNLDNMS